MNVDQAPRRELLNLITNQARLRYEVDDRTLAKEQIDLTQTASLKASGIAARDALADLLGNLGLSYRVTEHGPAVYHHGRAAGRRLGQEGRSRLKVRRSSWSCRNHGNRPTPPTAS